MCVCVVCVCICMLCISKMNDSKDVRDRREKLGLFCYYRVLSLLMKKYIVLSESGFGLVNPNVSMCSKI